MLTVTSSQGWPAKCPRLCPAAAKVSHTTVLRVHKNSFHPNQGMDKCRNSPL